MGFFDSLIDFAGGIPVVGDVIDAAQKGFNFFKDVSNTDSARQVDANQAVMAYQHELNKDMQQRQQAFNLEALNRSGDINSNLMNQAFGQNKALMNDQFVKNAALSSRSRDVFNARASGINPAEMSASYVGSIGGQSASASSVGSPSVGAPSASGASVSPSHYTAGSGTSTANFLEKSAIARERDSQVGVNQSAEKLNNSEAALKDVDLVTRSTKNLNEILEQYARIAKLESDKQVNEETAHRMRTMLAAEVNNLEASAENQRSQAFAAKENAQTRKNELDETRRHNSQMEALQDYQNVTNRMQVNINEQTAQAVIEREYALADKFTADALKTNEEKKHVAELMLSEIELNEAEKDLIVAKRHGQTTENYYMALKLKAQILNSILDSYLKYETARSEGVKQIKEGIGIILDFASGGAGKAAKAAGAVKAAKSSSSNNDPWSGFYDN